MPRKPVIIEDDAPATPAVTGAMDDWAYIAPMGVFMVFTAIGGQWPALYPATYVAKTLVVPFVLWHFWKHFTPIRWNHWWLGIVVGIVGLVQWVGMEKLMPHYPHLGGGDVFNPEKAFTSPAAMWAFILVRWAGASLLVPVMEELFWRDYVWRMIDTPRDFKSVPVGRFTWKALLGVALVFSTVHVQWPLAIVWGLLVGGLLVYTRSLGACIVAHATTNLLLGAYVLYTKEWAFW